MIDDMDLYYDEDNIENGSKINFYKCMKENGIDFDDIDPKENMPRFMVKVIKNEPTEFNKFNNVLYKLNKSNTFSIIEAMSYLTDDWIDEKVLLKCLDELNHYTLKNSFKAKYKIDSGMFGLNDIFV